MGPLAALRTRPLLVDVALAAISFAVSIGLMASGGLGAPADGYRSLDALGVVLALCSSLPLLWRRRMPYLALAVLSVATLVAYGFGYSADVQVGTIFALYGIGSSADSPAAVRRGQIAVLTLVVAGGAAAMIALGGVELPELVALVVLWSGPWLAGDMARLRREQIAELRERALRAEREAERERRLAAAEERARIARELHDSAGHAINVILLQAGAARLLRERDPLAAEAALRTVEDVARRTIGEIDRLVHQLREGEEPGAPASPVLAERGVAGLEALVADHRSSGLEVELRAAGEVRELPGDVDRALYRIVQEALTNAARHGSGTVDVDVGFGPEAVSLRVANPVRDASAPTGEAGWGIVGMRERAALLGGSLEAGRSNGRFLVDAVLPR